MTLVFDANRCREVRRVTGQPTGPECEACGVGPCVIAQGRARSQPIPLDPANDTEPLSTPEVPL